MSRGRSPLAGAQPTQVLGRAVAVLPGTGNLLGEQRCPRASLYGRSRHRGAAAAVAQRQPAARSPRQPSGSALTPLSPAPSLPPLGGSAQTTRRMQCAAAGQDEGPHGLLPGTPLLWHCGAPKPRRSLASFLLPARLLPAPAGSAAARSCRRSGLQAQTPGGEGRKRVITPGRSTALRPARPAPRDPRLPPRTRRPLGAEPAAAEGSGPPYLRLRERQLRRPQPSPSVGLALPARYRCCQGTAAPRGKEEESRSSATGRAETPQGTSSSSSGALRGHEERGRAPPAPRSPQSRGRDGARATNERVWPAGVGTDPHRSVQEVLDSRACPAKLSQVTESIRIH